MKNKKENKTEEKFIYHENLDKIGEIPIYYGFIPYKNPDIKKIDLELSKNLLEGDYIDNEEISEMKLPLHVEEKVALIRMYNENEMHSMVQPVMLYFKEPFKGSIKKNSNNFNRYCDLEILGGSKSIAEALLIQTTRAILAEEGYENICVEINSIGDKESINRFTRDLTNYYRKHLNDMHAECRQLFKKDPFDLLSCQNDKCKKINETAPKSMDFLSESSRQHFQEVLEYLETLGIPYKINNNLIGNKKYCTETIFSINNIDAINDKKKQKVLAIGVRYDGLSKKIASKKDIHGVGISILIKNNKQELRKEIKKTKKPFASFVQLGLESKLLSLNVIESLRKEKIPLFLSLARDRLGAQVSAVEKHRIPFALIMGKKEAVEKTIIVRDNNTHAQETVNLTDLPKYMKKLEK